jgi:predicted NAD/FAD-binding protein
MGSALWSAPRAKVLEIPVTFFVRFFENHGMLSVTGQPEWRVVRGGSASYVRALTAPFSDRIRTSSRVRRVERHQTHVVVDGETFDHVIFACHADQALAILADPTPSEHDVLGSIPFQDNEVVLHTDTSVLPGRRRAWASWNYHVRGGEEAPATVTYNMNRLQTLGTRTTYCVTLNATDAIAPDAILHRARFSHPVYTRAGLRARERHREISGQGRTHYCGAYWGFGFHEDGVRSAYAVARRLGVGG